MAIVFVTLLFALPTSVLVCVTRELDWLQGSSLVLLALVSVPAVVTSGVLLVQSLRAARGSWRVRGTAAPCPALPQAEPEQETRQLGEVLGTTVDADCLAGDDGAEWAG